MKKLLVTICAAALTAILPEAALHAQNCNKLSDKELEKKLLYTMDTCHVTAMSVVLVKGDKMIYTNALGVKDRSAGEPVGINDIYRIASISKSFSAAAIMQLVDEGKISLEVDVND